MIVLRNCRLVKELTEGYDGNYGDVRIDGKIIAEIRPAGHPFEGEFEEIDLEGKTLIPGLFELHAHLYSFIWNYFELQLMPPGKVMFGAYDFAREYLRQGYTTVRDCGSSYNSAAAVRDAIKEGILDGPRIISSGLIITPTEIGNDSFADLYREADGADAMRAACRKEFQLGNDFIKLMVTGAFMNEGGDPGVQIATMEEIKAAVEIADMAGSYVCAHCHGTEGIKNAIRAGVHTVEHGTYIDEEGIQMLKDAKDTYLVVTAAVSMCCLDPDNPDITPELLQKSIDCSQEEKDCINAAYNAGLKIGFGSDIDLVSLRNVPGYEFIARKDYFSFKDLDILLQATKYSAEIARLDHLVGTVKEGKLADLIVIDGNPDEDIYAMKKLPVHVFKEGKRFNG